MLDVNCNNQLATLVKYLDNTDQNSKRLEISFVGMEWSDDKRKNSNISDVTVRLMNCKKLNDEYIPINEIWQQTFIGVTVPYGIWNGFKLGELTDNKVFAAIGQSIHEFNIETGDIKWTFSPGNTPIRRIGLTSDKSELNILYSEDDFIASHERSNLFRIIVKNGCSLKWSAELIWQNDLIGNFKQTENGLFAWTFKGIELTLDEKNGNIIQSVLVK